MLHIRGFFLHISLTRSPLSFTRGFNSRRAVSPLRVELFSFRLTPYASPAAPGYKGFPLSPGWDFHPLTLYQARYRIGSSALFPGRPYSKRKSLLGRSPHFSGQLPPQPRKHLSMHAAARVYATYLGGGQVVAHTQGTPPVASRIVPLLLHVRVSFSFFIHLLS